MACRITIGWFPLPDMLPAKHVPYSASRLAISQLELPTSPDGGSIRLRTELASHLAINKEVNAMQRNTFPLHAKLHVSLHYKSIIDYSTDWMFTFLNENTLKTKQIACKWQNKPTNIVCLFWIIEHK